MGSNGLTPGKVPCRMDVTDCISLTSLRIVHPANDAAKQQTSYLFGKHSSSNGKKKTKKTKWNQYGDTVKWRFCLRWQSSVQKGHMNVAGHYLILMLQSQKWPYIKPTFLTRVLIVCSTLLETFCMITTSMRHRNPIFVIFGSLLHFSKGHCNHWLVDIITLKHDYFDFWPILQTLVNTL